MNELQSLVRWTRLGLVSLFVMIITLELVLGVFVIENEISSPIVSDTTFDYIINLLGVLIVMAEIFSVGLLYRKRKKYIQLLDNLETKLKEFGKAYLANMFFSGLGGVAALLGYFCTHELLWFVPWLIMLYCMGKNYPFKINLIHNMSVVKDEEKELFL
ncbi:hypothetical protein ACT3CE_06865 [Marinifilum sp. RC60d5]|uniref:hypothetical protein n=1 Tax=Marinifilum sp. RC60d5 TaxID=3458414 RepID=UPI004036223D